MNRPQIKADWVAGVIIGLLVSIQAVAIHLTRLYARGQSESSGSSSGSPEVAQETAIASAGEILVIAAVEIAVILLLWRGYKRLPERWKARIQTVLKYGGIGTLYMLGLLAYYPDAAIQYIVSVPVLYGVVRYVKSILGSNGLKWLAFNLVAVTIGTVVVFMAGLNLSPRLVIVVMIAFMLYDHWAVHLTSVMSDFVQLSSKTKFPNFLVVPNQLHVDLGHLHEFIQGEREEKPEEIAVVIGLGDFIFPSILVVSIFVAGSYSLSLPVLTTVAGLALSVLILRGALERAESGLPALPYLNTGAIAGYAVGILVTVVLPG